MSRPGDENRLLKKGALIVAGSVASRLYAAHVRQCFPLPPITDEDMDELMGLGNFNAVMRFNPHIDVVVLLIFGGCSLSRLVD